MFFIIEMHWNPLLNYDTKRSFFIQWSEKCSICASSVSIHLNLNVFIGLTDVPDIPRGRTDDGTVSVRVYREDIPKSTGMVGSQPNRLHLCVNRSAC